MALTLAGAIDATGAAAILIDWVTVCVPPTLSMTVRLMTTVPAAVVASVTLLPSVAPVKLASPAPLAMAHWKPAIVRPAAADDALPLSVTGSPTVAAAVASAMTAVGCKGEA